MPSTLGRPPPEVNHRPCMKKPADRRESPTHRPVVTYRRKLAVARWLEVVVVVAAAAGGMAATGAGRPSSSGFSATSASVVSIRPATDAAFCSAVAHDLGRVDDAGLDQVLVLLGGGVEAERALAVLDLLDHDRAVDARVVGDLAQRLLDRAADDVDAVLPVVAELQARRAPTARGSAPRRRRGRCPPRPPRGSRAARPRRAPSSPSSPTRWPRRP